MKRILTYGTYDLLHWGHIRLLKRAKQLGDYLIVGLSTDEFNAIKGKKAYHSYEERKMMLEAIRYVDLVIPEENWDQKIKDIKEYKLKAMLERVRDMVEKRTIRMEDLINEYNQTNDTKGETNENILHE